MVEIRPATADDAKTIKQMVRNARLDPTSLKWQRFLIAEVDSQIVGIGQVKQYPGCEELGSLVVARPFRKQGIAGELIAALEARSGRPLYLFCASHLEGFYQQFGYETIGFWQAPNFLKLKLLPTIFFRLFGIRVLIMRKT